MSDDSIFNSKTEPIPEIRRDLQIIPRQENGSSYLYFHDMRQYATSDLALQRQTETLLSLIDGRKSVKDLERYLGDGVTESDLLEFIQFLDQHRLLNSEHFKDYAEQTEAEYEQSMVHQSVAAGASYPADPDELRNYLDEAFGKHELKQVTVHPKALYAPHIDPRVALDSYVEAFAPIRSLKPKRVVILATSHYAGWYPDLYEEYPFILVNKDFAMPLDTIRRDQEIITELAASTDCGITTHDRAHRMEHSIELHLLFLSYLWDHDFTIIPFLTRGLDDLYYMEDGHLGQQLKNFSELLNSTFGSDEETFFLISGDLAHFGRKFGDASPASTMFDEVKSFDKRFLQYGSGSRKRELLDLMKEEMNSYRICGFPPLYTFLNSMPELKGEVLTYDLWDERERESAVTFGAILYGNADDTG